MQSHTLNFVEFGGFAALDHNKVTFAELHIFVIKLKVGNFASDGAGFSPEFSNAEINTKEPDLVLESLLFL